MEKKQFPPSALEVADWCDRKTSEYQELVAAAAAAKSVAPDPRWRLIFERLKTRYGEAVAASWFTRATLGDIANGVATIMVPTEFLSSWLRQNYEDQMLRAVGAEHPGTVKIIFAVKRS